MTTTYIGADPVALDALGRHLLDHAEALEVVRSRLSVELYEAGWFGDDADTALAEWEAQHVPAMGSVVAVLLMMGQRLLDNAAAQREASAADGATLSAAPLPMRPPPTDPESLRDYWISLAARNAGIDMSQWEPDRGADELRPIIEGVYSYYGDLYLNHPYLMWAGMANMVGPAFAAGFYDLAMFRDLARVLGGRPGVPPFVSALAHCTDEELKFFETTFLTMQQDIFLDQAMMHEAYLNGGLTAIRELQEAGLIDPKTVEAWEQIDEGRRTGDFDLVAQGNEDLLLREQKDIIDGYYQQMYQHNGPIGQAFTYLMTAVGEPSIPGAQSYGDYDPLVLTTDVGVGPESVFGFDNPVEGDLHVRTPLPNGNIAVFEDRWDYITDDTLPAYQELLRNSPQQATDIIGSDVGDRIDDYRIYNRIDTLLEHYATDWGADIDQ